MLKFLVVLLICIAPFSGHAKSFYVALNGSDSNNASMSSPLRTIQKAINLSSNYIKNENVTIYIKPGETYSEKRIQITQNQVSDKYNLTIRALDLKNRPIFTGDITANFLTFRNTKSGRTNIHINGIILKNYKEGITIAGTRHEHFNSHNSIKNCDFLHMGVTPSTNSSLAYSIIGLSNSRHNLIEGNSFIDNKNHPSRGSYLHSIYMSHEASFNIIKNNYFKDISGDPIRIRDYSNDNTITGNTFINEIGSAVYMVSTWFCEHASSSACTSIQPECPSLNNKVLNNQYTGSSITKVRVAFNANTSKCHRNINDNIHFSKIEKNINTTNGICKIQAINSCPRMLTHTNAIVDHLGNTAENCFKRAKDYYASCGRNVENDYFNAIKSTWFNRLDDYIYKESEEQLAGKGCYIRAENCSRMRLTDHKFKMDSLAYQKNMSASSCTGQRLKAWFGSCSKTKPDESRYVEAIFLDKLTAEPITELIGNGCIVTANHCQRMGIKPNGHRIDKNSNAKKSANACLNRINTWLQSCTRGELADTNVTIQMTYFSNGKIQAQRRLSRFSN